MSIHASDILCPLFTINQVKHCIAKKHVIINFSINSNFEPIIDFEDKINGIRGYYPICKEIFDVLEDITYNNPVSLYIKSSVMDHMLRYNEKEYQTILEGIGNVEIDYLALTMIQLDLSAYDAFNRVIDSLHNVECRYLCFNSTPKCIFFASTRDAIINYIMRSKISQLDCLTIWDANKTFKPFMDAIGEAVKTPMHERFIPLESRSKSAAKRN